jgi:hypothetical protein
MRNCKICNSLRRIVRNETKGWGKEETGRQRDTGTLGQKDGFDSEMQH